MACWSLGPAASSPIYCRTAKISPSSPNSLTDALREAKDLPRDVAAAIAPCAAWLGFAEHDGPALLNWLLHLAREPQLQSRQPPQGVDSGPREAAPAGQQYLLVQSF